MTVWVGHDVLWTQLFISQCKFGMHGRNYFEFGLEIGYIELWVIIIVIISSDHDIIYLFIIGLYGKELYHVFVWSLCLSISRQRLLNWPADCNFLFE